jgi:sugar phosphate isomerase/epimerase
MRFGICAPVERAAELKAAGCDFVEENVQNFLQGLVEDSKWLGQAKASASPLTVLAANSLVPGDIKIVGPAVDLAKLRNYMAAVLRRAQSVGMKILVFGSAGARNVPEGFDRQKARRQILDFIRMAAPLAQSNGVTLVAEPLNHTESNIINTVSEAMSYVKDVNHPSFQCLVDSYHFWIDNDSLADLKDAMPWIRHVHVADKDGRVAPGESGTADYRPFFKVIKAAGYTGVVSVEALGFTDFKTVAPRVLGFLRRQWQEA